MIEAERKQGQPVSESKQVPKGEMKERKHHEEMQGPRNPSAALS
jgi:hypothetical protein